MILRTNYKLQQHCSNYLVCVHNWSEEKMFAYMTSLLLSCKSCGSLKRNIVSVHKTPPLKIPERRK